ncbi:MAG: YidC/Oxa1 family membrane protein insertase [Lachnospiraceae bacterium]|nr:YidC/Oxa1 family membrane protein insertase [Lachnospiraceae bacterium]
MNTILKPFAIALGFIMDWLYRVMGLLGLTNIGLTIILFTLIVNLLMIPLTIKQLKYSKLTALINPEIRAIQKKYQGRKDEASMRKQQYETQMVYDKYGASPTGGCLPLLIQLPILLALYRVIYNVPGFVASIRDIYMNIGTPIMENADVAEGIITSFISDNSIRLTSSFDITQVSSVVEFLYKVKSTAWDALNQNFSLVVPSVSEAISNWSGRIVELTSLPGGLNIVDAPVSLSNGISGLFPGVLIPILAGASQYWSIFVTQKDQPAADDGSGMASSMKTMNYMMPLMSVFFCVTLPAGMGIYWIASAVFRTLITMVLRRTIKVDTEALVEKNKDKAAAKSQKRKEQYERVDQYANMKTRNISGGSASGEYRKDSITGIARGSVSHDEADSSKSSGKKNYSKSGGSGKKQLIVDEDARAKKSISGYAHMIKKDDD